jgi:hypothetical protein
MQVVQISILTKIKAMQALILTTFQFLHVWWKEIDKILNCIILFWNFFGVFFWVMMDLWFCGDLETSSWFIPDNFKKIHDLYFLLPYLPSQIINFWNDV